MDSIKLHENALLAEASYAKFHEFASMEEALIDGDFSLKQVGRFTTDWEIASHQPNTESGFSATLFRRKTADPVSGYEIGDYVYAIRGTEPGVPDILETDINDIALDTLALDQIVDLYNDWTRINTNQGETYQVAKLVTFAGDGNPNHVILDQPLGEYKTITFSESTAVFK